MNGKVLVIEDEELVGTMVRINLEGAGFEITWLKNGQEALRTVRHDNFDLILLDISLPGMSGLEFLKEIRRREITTPVMMLTARGEVQTKVEAFAIGADDYLPKPFDVAELIARVQALVRRSQGEREIPSDQIVRLGKYQINLATREAISNVGPIVLSEKEAALVRVLVRARGQALARADILDEVWGMDAYPTERTVDNFIVRLRKLFEPDPENPKHFLTVRGTGYRFNP